MIQAHMLHAAIKFKPRVTFDQVITALQPLSQARGWSEAQLRNSTLPMNDDVTLIFSEGFVESLTLLTHGDVTSDYVDVVDAVGRLLVGVACPGHLELTLSDGAGQRELTKLIWYGTPAQIKFAQQLYAIKNAQSALMAAGVDGISLKGLTVIRRVLESANTTTESENVQGAISDLSVLVAALAFLHGDKGIDVRNLYDAGLGRAGYMPLFGEGINFAKRDGAVFAVGLPHTAGFWYCFDQAGKLVAHLVPQFTGHWYVGRSHTDPGNSA